MRARSFHRKLFSPANRSPHCSALMYNQSQ
jgi:hypothetical protein